MKREGSNMLADIHIPHRRCFQIHIDLLSLSGVQADSLSRTQKNKIKMLNEKPNRNIDPGPSLSCQVSVIAHSRGLIRRLNVKSIIITGDFGSLFGRQMEMTERYF